jgi:hypothetical protein
MNLKTIKTLIFKYLTFIYNVCMMIDECLFVLINVTFLNPDKYVSIVSNIFLIRRMNKLIFDFQLIHFLRDFLKYNLTLIFSK